MRRKSELTFGLIETLHNVNTIFTEGRDARSPSVPVVTRAHRKDLIFTKVLRVSSRPHADTIQGWNRAELNCTFINAKMGCSTLR